MKECLINWNRMMNVSLTHELEAYISTQVKSGLYNSASEVIREALRNQIKKSLVSELSQRLAISRKQVNDGDVLIVDKQYFESKRNRLRQKHLNTKL